MTGWKAVQRGSSPFNHDLQAIPLEIRTDSALGSGDEMLLDFYSSGGEFAGGLSIRLTSDPGYYLDYCTEEWNSFPNGLPTGKEKLWRIAVIKTSDLHKLQILCNEKKVLDFVISNSTCPLPLWNTFSWNNDIKKILISPGDTMSDDYRPYQQLGN